MFYRRWWINKFVALLESLKNFCTRNEINKYLGVEEKDNEDAECKQRRHIYGNHTSFIVKI